MIDANEINTGENVLGSFLIEQLPLTLRDTYLLLVTLQYPIPDKKSLSQQLDQAEGGDSVKSILREVFKVTDFGIDSVQSGLEKYTHRLEQAYATREGYGRGFMPLPIPFHFSPKLPPELPDEPFFPPATNPDFGTDPCGFAARNLYAHLVRAGVHPAEAEFSARSKANYCRMYMPSLGTDGCAERGRREFARLFVEEGLDAGLSSARVLVGIDIARRSGIC